MTIAHEFPEGEDVKRRCIWCGTTFELHAARAQNCVPRRSYGEIMRPEPARHQSAVEDFDTIGARLLELRHEKSLAINRSDDDLTGVAV